MPDHDLTHEYITLWRKIKLRICSKISNIRCMHGSRGVGNRGSRPPLKNHKNIGFRSNTGPDPLKIAKLPSQNSMLGHHRHASKAPFKWHFASRRIIARLKWYLAPSSPDQPKKGCQSWTPSDKTGRIQA